MSTVVLIPGAGGDAWYWHLVVPELRARGHRVVPVDLPADDEKAGLDVSVDAAVAAVDRSEVDRSDVVVVGQSMGGLTAPLLCDRLPVRLLVLLNAMTPRPGETGGQWWSATGHRQAYVAAARAARWDPEADDWIGNAFFHDVPAAVTAAAFARGELAQSDRPFADPFPLDRWPDVPTRFLQGRDDRFFPLEFQRRVVAERLGPLGVTVDEMPGGHLVALSRPVELAERLCEYL
ncbi:alpha/beta hydrolase [Nakamurella flava]|uniref:Alpha/beta hydrolase n=1 Tax=Nakamurella flava TaxID=2576308 RepID=A0A4U6QLA5_9ACTN|nr:alpha/beta hydrolase [Nakamurella flava]TKV60922.1 alpha/beta hydrolase [Nakamurella flava]